MVHVHGVRALELSSRTVGIGLERLVAVPVDVGKPTALAMVCDFTGRRLAAPSHEGTPPCAGISLTGPTAS